MDNTKFTISPSLLLQVRTIGSPGSARCSKCVVHDVRPLSLPNDAHINHEQSQVWSCQKLHFISNGKKYWAKNYRIYPPQCNYVRYILLLNNKIPHLPVYSSFAQIFNGIKWIFCLNKHVMLYKHQSLPLTVDPAGINTTIGRQKVQIQ